MKSIHTSSEEEALVKVHELNTDAAKFTPDLRTKNESGRNMCHREGTDFI